VTAIPGTLLVVDDSATNRLRLAHHLQHQGHTIVQAADGRAALDLLGQQGFDLVLLDIMMPEINGLDVLRQMKASSTLRHIPVIVISAYDDLDHVVQAITMGAEDYLTKPFQAVLLKARIDACLEKKRLRDAEQAYLEQVARVTAAAAAVENGTFDVSSLDDVAQRSDELGQMARVFQRMAREVSAREAQLRQQVSSLQIEIDKTRMSRHVSEITETSFFKDLQQNAQSLRDEMSIARDEPEQSDDQTPPRQVGADL
jgi:DNA-binding response OmpR family regulator